MRILHTLLAELKQKCYFSKEYTTFIVSWKENAACGFALFILSNLIVIIFLSSSQEKALKLSQK